MENSPARMDKEVEDVRRFHQKFGILDSGTVPTMLAKRKLQERIECMQEELDEFKKAVAEQDFPEQADALIDLVYFAKGTAVMMGLPWAELWDDVQRANMDKVRGVGKRGHAVDMIKPEGWQKPDGARILMEAGFRPEIFTANGIVDENECLDDSPAYKIFQASKKLLSAANNIPIGDNMMSPVALFDAAGKALHPSATTEVTDDQVWAACSRKISLTSFENSDLAAFKADGLTHVHMYEVRLMDKGFTDRKVGDTVKTFDTYTFQEIEIEVTQEMIDSWNYVVIRFGVQERLNQKTADLVE